MILSDWISNIRWKYFTNNKSGLIFKELMKEFRPVEQMTENCNDCKYEKECNHTEKYDYTYDKIMDYQTNKEYNSFKDICDLLNEQEKEIQKIYSTLDDRIEKLQEDLEKLNALDKTEDLHPQAVEDVTIVLSISLNALKEFKKELMGDTE